MGLHSRLQQLPDVAALGEVVLKNELLTQSLFFFLLINLMAVLDLKRSSRVNGMM